MDGVSSPSQTRQSLDDLCARGFLIADDGDFLALSVPLLSAYQISAKGMDRLRSSLEQRGGAMAGAD